jgi:PAS domain S-box-containing protein
MRFHQRAIYLVRSRKRAEEALRNSEERVRLILDSAAEGIFGCDPEGTGLFCNPAAVRLLGYDDPSELLGKNMHALEHHTRPDGRPKADGRCPGVDVNVAFHVNFETAEGKEEEYSHLIQQMDGKGNARPPTLLTKPHAATQPHPMRGFEQG